MAINDPFRQQLRRNLIENFCQDITNIADNHYFLSIGKTTEWVDATGTTNDNFPPKNIDSINSDTEFWRNILAYKRIKPENVSLVIPRYDWEPGSVYDNYRDSVDLFDDTNPSKFYVLVDEERVYKCIDNNYDSPSTVAPTHTDSQIRTLSDGYRWKFLYQITESKRKFLTKGFSNKTGYMPVEYISLLKDNDERILQWNVQQAAVDGSIDFVNLTEDIRSKVISSKVIFPADENQVVGATSAGSSSVIISGPGLVYSNNYYNNMVLRIDSGLGAGQQRVINSYVAGVNTATVYLETPLNIGLTSGTGSDASLYSILPQVNIVGDGSSYNNSLNTFSTDAEVTVKFLSTSITGGARYIDTIEVIDSGQHYTFAEIEIVNGLTSYPGLSADLSLLAQPVLSPPGGHGSNPVKELGCPALMVVVEFSQDEDGKINIDNDYRQFGIIKNPELFYTQSRLTLSGSALASSFTANDFVQSGTAAGSVVSWYPGLTYAANTSELVVTTTRGNFEIGMTFGTPVYTVTNVETRDLAGSEGRNLKKLKLVPLGTTGTTFDPSGLDYKRGYIAIGVGNTSDQVYPSFSTGKIYSWNPENGSNLVGSLYLENYNGTFKLGECVSEIRQDFTSDYSGPLGKIIEIDTDEASNLDTYTQTFNFLLTYDGANVFDSTSFEFDSIIASLSGGYEVGKGYVVDWNPVTGGTQGNLILNGVWGQFLTGNNIIYNNGGTTGAIISEIVSYPDILYHTGEILHIQNIRPIERSIEQREEIKFIIQF